MMLPLARIHLLDLYESAVSFLNLRSLGLSSPGAPAAQFVYPDSDSDTLLPRVLPERGNNYRDVADANSLLGAQQVESRASREYLEHDTDTQGGQQLVHSTETALESPTRDSSQMRSELTLLREKHDALQTALRDSQRLVTQKDAQLEQLREKNRKLEADLRDMQHLAEERAMEVKSLETFLTKTDRWAGAQIVQTAKDLNAEILQFSAAASESFAVERRDLQHTSGRQKAIEWVRARHGVALTRCLERRDHAQDPTLLQYAMQASVAYCLCKALSSFYFGSPSKFDTILMKIYLHMHATEPQATSARWRALTHNHIRALTPNIDKVSVSESFDSNANGIAHILCAAGYGDVDNQVEKIQSRFGSQLRRIIDMASKTALIIREGTMSTDFQPYFVDYSKEYDAATMQNLYDGHGPSRGSVLCTTEMGLRCYTNTGREGRNPDENDIEKLVVLMPKVVLESVVHILDRE